MITAIFALITHLIVYILASKKNPTAIEDNIYVKLLLSSMFFYTSSMNTYDVTDASDLWAVFDSFAMENTVNKLVTFARFVSQSIMRLVDYLDRADILVVRCFVR